MQRSVFRWIQWAAVAVLLGRAWQHIVFDAPYRALLWDEAWMSGIVDRFLGLNWSDFVTDPTIDATIQLGIQWVGGLLLLAGLTALFIRRLPSWMKVFVIAGGIVLFLLAVMYMKEKFFHLGQLLEYSLQVGTPFFLLAALRQNLHEKKLILIMKGAIALTFVCHGLYAVGFYPRPGSFMDMTINILGVSNRQAVQFLWAAGILDFIASILIFLPGKWSRAGLLYCVFWGTATSVARVAGNFYIDFWWSSLHQWLPEMIFRFPHFLIPLAVFRWEQLRSRVPRPF
jgi:hypothetical protein